MRTDRLRDGPERTQASAPDRFPHMTLPDLPSRRDAGPDPVGPRFPRREPLALSCPRCNLVIYPRVTTIAPHQCPRCRARRRVGVMLQRNEDNAADLGGELPPVGR